jgi:hypothetical protein
MSSFELTQAKRTGWIAATLTAMMLTSGAVHAQQVGTAAAVNPAAQARGAGGSRTIVIGQSIAHKERIQTTSAGSVQLLFLDKTSMTIGPNSDLAIDEYVYDPASNTGKLAATLSKGVMRFVGGQISHAGNAEIKTPSAVVGIRGGVGIFQPNSIYIGYGEGSVRSGGTNLILGAGEYIQTFGTGQPPTTPGAPPANFLQSVLASLQSQAGQGGGARASSGQVNQARTNATGSATGNIASNPQNLVNQIVNLATLNNAASNINQTIQTTAVQARIEQPQQGEGGTEPEGGGAQVLTAFTGGLGFNRNNFGPFGAVMALLGAGAVETDEKGQIKFAGLGAANVGSIGSSPYNPYGTQQDKFGVGFFIYGPQTGTVDIEELPIGAQQVLLPSTGSGGVPAAVVNNQFLSQFEGGVLEIKPGTTLSKMASEAVGTAFCQCEYTKWGLWRAETSRPGQYPAGGPVRDVVESFWVAGRPTADIDIPSTGTATYVGHAIGHIQNGGSSYVSAGSFRNEVNFGSRSGAVTVNNFDNANYSGQVQFAGNTAYFGSLNGSSGRAMTMLGMFFQGKSSPYGETGGSFQVLGANSNYGGAGIFAGKKQ